MADIHELLAAINPAFLDYQEWLNVGMALKHEGLTAGDWDAWSARDAARHHGRECFTKWDGFRGNGTPVTAGTLVKLARDQGWTGHLDSDSEHGAEIPWDAVIGGHEKPDLQVIDRNWIQDVDVPPPPSNWDGKRDLIDYLTALFSSDDHVAYSMQCWDHESGKKLPQKGCWDRTAGELIDKLRTKDIANVMGDSDPVAGAWIRLNPFDGKDVRDENVTAFRFALVESDELSIDRQYALLRELELPIRALVHSGGKSLHAVVCVDADDYQDYRRRVDFLYEVCQRNGLQLDRQNRNPSRLSRMPGVIRNGKPQYLIARNIGKASWAEWREWIEDLNDDLPDIEDAVIGEDEPPLAPEIIAGVLREGHKMLLSGPSKAGKSFSLMQLCIAMAEGREWMGWQVERGRVLYINLELDKRSAKHRLWMIYQANRMHQTAGMLDVWNLRGHATSLDKLTPKLIRRCRERRYKMVVIDPIYKVITGDENSAEAMASFCNHFDRICMELGAAVVYCHHHSKGAQGHKSSADRSSGSGVFSRDPDAILDLIELQIDDARRKMIVGRWECDAMSAALDASASDWREHCPQDDAVVADKLAAWADSNGHGDAIRDVRPAARAAATYATGWRVETTLREFPDLPPFPMFFRYPLHVSDNGLLQDAKADGEEAPYEAARRKRREAGKTKQQDSREALDAAYMANDMGEPVTLEDMAQYMGITDRQVRRHVKNHPGYVIDDCHIVPVSKAKEMG